MSGELMADLAELNEQLVAEGVTQGEAAVAGASVGGVFGAMWGALAGALAVIGVVALVIAILKIIAYWRLFSKAGEAGWKSIIPILDSYTETKIAGTNNWVRIVISYIAICVGYGMMSSVPSGETSTLATIGAVITLIAIIWYIVERIIRFNGLAKNFGKGTGFVVAWVFFPTICELILGLGGSQYNKIN